MASIAYAEQPWPNGRDVAAFLGQSTDVELAALAQQHVAIIKAMARAYTRGKGFTDGGPSDDIGAVIIAATARLVANPEQIDIRAGEVSVRGSFNGWTLAESFVLNRYRKRAK